jgi:hypothetical protein
VRTPPDEILSEVRASGTSSSFDPRDLKYTSTDLQSVTLTSGERVVVKHLASDGDWLMRATGGVGRAQELWRGGVLSALEPVVDHGVIGLVDFGDHDAIVMRDLSGKLIPEVAMLAPHYVEAVLRAMARFHEAAATLNLPPLCSVAARCNVMNPAFHETDQGPGRLASGASVRAALELLASRATRAGAAALWRVIDDPDAFAAEVAEHTKRLTLVHGDAKPPNLGYLGGRLVAIDWGELTGPGPAEIDVVRFAFSACDLYCDLQPNDMFEMYDRHARLPLDPDLLRLAILGDVACFGVGRLAAMRDLTDDAVRERAKANFRSGMARFRLAFPDPASG